MPLFGTSGIRGPYPSEIHEELFLRLGAALATLYETVVVGRDVRRSGPPLQSALLAGLASGGARALDCGMVATPTVAHLAAHFDVGGIVTASHNPAGYNGLKLWSSSGMALDALGQSRVEEALGQETPAPTWDGVGAIHPYAGALEEHQEKVLAGVEPADLSVVVDCGNGATSRLTPFVLRAQGCSVTALNAQPDGAFPGRGPEPTETALVGLRRAVARGPRLGVAHDGDGDRMVAVDEAGRMIPGDALFVLFARVVKAAKVVVPVDASMALEDVLGKGRVHRTRVGDVYVAEAILREGADFGGEASGTWIFPDFALCPDGVYAAAVLCAALAEDPLDAWVGDVPSYPLRRGAIEYPPGADLSSLEESLAAVESDAITTLDGWRFDFGDGWGLVRLSGTEPKIRLTAEAREEGRTKALYDRLHHAVAKAVG